MWLDARIPLLLLPGRLLAPASDLCGVLLMVGDVGRDWPADDLVGWSAVRRLDVDTTGAGAGVHLAGCACCAERSRLAVSLSELFQERARGRLGLFRTVLLAVPATDLRPAEALLAADPLVTARYRVMAALG